jgi:hypothetical protein
VISVSAGVVVGNLIRDGSVSCGETVGVVFVTTLMVVVLWGGAALLGEIKGLIGSARASRGSVAKRQSARDS